jgi:hypothetical protein
MKPNILCNSLASEAKISPVQVSTLGAAQLSLQ